MNDFVDKVYDSYLKDDYKFGDDNLNPKHEIKKAQKLGIDNELDALLAKISSRMDEINDRWPDLDKAGVSKAQTEDLNAGAAFGGGEKSGPVNMARKKAINKAGGDGTNPYSSLLDLGLPNNTPGTRDDYLERKAEDIIAKILASVPGIEKGPEKDYSGSDNDSDKYKEKDKKYKPKTIVINPIIGTSGTTGGNGEGDGGDDNIGFPITEFDGGDTGDWTYDYGDKSPIGTPPSGDGSSPQTTRPSPSPLDGIALNNIDCQYTVNAFTGVVDTGDINELDEEDDEKANTENDEEPDEPEYGDLDISVGQEQATAIDEDNMLIQECAMADIAWLKIFLIVLKIVKMLKMMLNPALNIVVELIEIITLAVGCWCCPAGAAEIVQKIVQKIIAVLIGLVGNLLQQLWNLLGLDCITSMTKDTLNQIKAALSDIAAVWGEVMSLAVPFKSVGNAWDQTVKASTKAFNDYMDQIQDLKQSIKDMEPSFPEGYDPEEAKKAKAQARKDLIKGKVTSAAGTGLSNGLSNWQSQLGGDALDSAMDAYHSAQDIIKQAQELSKIFGGQAKAGSAEASMAQASTVLSGLSPTSDEEDS